MSSYPKRIALLGSTGSIGRQTLDIVRSFPGHFQVVALAAHSNLDLLAEQAREFNPSLVACFADSAEVEQKARQLFPNVILGERGLLAAATHADADVLVAATSGLVGLRPTLAAIEAGKTIALANKETLVMAGHIVTEAARRNGVSIVPIDSEHSAIWQCLHGEENNQIRRLMITASGGPFRTTPLEELHDVSVEQALAHPTWKMGPKITIDSATLMNKGLEVIESYWLFDVPYERIEVVVHPESIIHSMVEFCDGSIKMQASLPTMHIPIMHALTYPERLDTADKNLIREVRWPSIAALHFEELNLERFPCFRLALEAGKRGGTYPCALVGADEEAVAMFLEGKIRYQGIAQMLEAVLEQHNSIAQPDVNATLEACAWARRTAREWGEKHLAG